MNKSTVPIGSGDCVKMLVMDGVTQRSKQPALVGGGSPESSQPMAKFDVVSNPEFLREGSAVYDTFNPDRIVLGSGSEYAIELMQKLSAPIAVANHPNPLPINDKVVKL